MIELLKALLLNAKGNPITTALGFVALGLVGAGKMLSDNAFEPWGTALSGVGAMIAIVLGFVAKDKMKPPTEPPQ